MPLIMMVAIFAMPAAAPPQTRSQPVTADESLDEKDDQFPLQIRPTLNQPTPPGRVSKSAAGEVGQRQTRETITYSAGAVRRIDNRIHNRIQSRLRNRIDRDYDPDAGVSTPFEAAEVESRKGGRPNQ